MVGHARARAAAVPFAQVWQTGLLAYAGPHRGGRPGCSTEIPTGSRVAASDTLGARIALRTDLYLIGDTYGPTDRHCPPRSSTRWSGSPSTRARTSRPGARRGRASPQLLDSGDFQRGGGGRRRRRGPARASPDARRVASRAMDEPDLPRLRGVRRVAHLLRLRARPPDEPGPGRPHRRARRASSACSTGCRGARTRRHRRRPAHRARPRPDRGGDGAAAPTRRGPTSRTGSAATTTRSSRTCTQAARHVVGASIEAARQVWTGRGRPRRQHRRRTAPRDAGPGQRLLRLQRRGRRDPVAARPTARSRSPTSTSTCTTATAWSGSSTTTRGC